LLSAYPEGLRLGGNTLGTQQDHSLDALQAIFAGALERSLAHGLPRDYQPRREDLRRVQGRLDWHYLHTVCYGRFPPLRCSFEEQTYDIESNRRLLAAARLLAGHYGSTDARRSLRTSINKLDPLVRTVRYGPTVRPVEHSPLVARQLGRGAPTYFTALELSQVVLRQATIEFQPGGLSTLAFLVDMNKAFERFLSRSLRSELGVAQKYWRDEPTVFINARGSVRARPDILWKHPSGLPVVIDAKWKVSKAGEAQDVKQMALYCAALGVQEGMLVYGEIEGRTTHRIRHCGIRVHIESLDVTGSVDQIQQATEILAGRVRSMAASNATSRRMTP